MFHQRRAFLRFAGVFILGAAWAAGCAGPGPRVFPFDPVDVEKLSGGGERRWYDTAGGQGGNYYETLAPEGRIIEIGYGARGTRPAAVVNLDVVPAAERRDLVLLLDSISYCVVEDLWRQGRLRYFYRPSHQVAPFPAMTDLCFSEFFGTSPSPGVEAEYFNGKRLTSGYEVYAAGGNTQWERHVQYVMNPVLHVQTYLDPYPWLDHELRAIEDDFLRRSLPIYIGYCVGTSAVGAKYGREGHERAMDRIERLCRQLVYETQGRIRLTMLSDHGHAFYNSLRIPLADRLRDLGYRPGMTLKGPRDVVVPEFGMVSCAVVHTRSPAEVARDVLKIEGIELSAYRDGEDLVVLSSDGRARISRSGDRFRYEAELGDPLLLRAELTELRQQGRMDAESFVSDGALWMASADGVYPDAVGRLWRAFHGLVQNTPDVMLSIAEGYHAGSPTMTRLLELVGVHGSLRQMSTYGFAMSMAGELPEFIRMQDLRPALNRLGVPILGQAATHPAVAMNPD